MAIVQLKGEDQNGKETVHTVDTNEVILPSSPNRNIVFVHYNSKLMRKPILIYSSELKILIAAVYDNKGR